MSMSAKEKTTENCIKIKKNL